MTQSVLRLEVMNVIFIGHFELLVNILRLKLLMDLRIYCVGHLPSPHPDHQLAHCHRILACHSEVLGSSFSSIWAAVAAPCSRCLHMLESEPDLLFLGRHLVSVAASSCLF